MITLLLHKLNNIFLDYVFGNKRKKITIFKYLLLEVYLYKYLLNTNS